MSSLEVNEKMNVENKHFETFSGDLCRLGVLSPKEVKLGNARFKEFFGDLRKLEILLSYITIHNIHTLMFVLPHLAKSVELKKYLANRFKESVMKKLKDDYGVKNPEILLSLIKKGGSEISGSFVMACYYGEDWGEMDIDIFGTVDNSKVPEGYPDYKARLTTSYTKFGAPFDYITEPDDPRYLLKHLCCNYLYLGEWKYFDAFSKYWISEDNAKKHKKAYSDEPLLSKELEDKLKSFDNYNDLIKEMISPFLRNGESQEETLYEMVAPFLRYGESQEETLYEISIPKFLKYNIGDSEFLWNYDGIKDKGIINTIFMDKNKFGISTTREFIDKTFDFAFCKLSFDGERVYIPHPKEMVYKRTKILGHCSLFDKRKENIHEKLESRIKKYIKRGFKFPKALYMQEQIAIKEGYIEKKVIENALGKSTVEESDIHSMLLFAILFGTKKDILDSRHAYGNVDVGVKNLEEFIESIIDGKLLYQKREYELSSSEEEEEEKEEVVEFVTENVPRRSERIKRKREEQEKKKRKNVRKRILKEPKR